MCQFMCSTWSIWKSRKSQSEFQWLGKAPEHFLATEKRTVWTNVNIGVSLRTKEMQRMLFTILKCDNHDKPILLTVPWKYKIKRRNFHAFDCIFLSELDWCQFQLESIAFDLHFHKKQVVFNLHRNIIIYMHFLSSFAMQKWYSYWLNGAQVSRISFQVFLSFDKNWAARDVMQSFEYNFHFHRMRFRSNIFEALAVTR